MSFDHTFSGNPLDRAEPQRRDEAWLDAARHSDDARFLPFWKLNVLVRDAHLGWLTAAQVADVTIEGEPVLLGIRDGAAHYAIDVSGIEDPLATINVPSGARFEDCRAAAMTMAESTETGIIAQARAQVGWHVSHRFCSQCGAPSESRKGGHERVCPSCDAHHFPRTDPVAIMLVADGDRCLLGQSHGPLVALGMYSALAGFVDQGESIEEAVRREIKEEAGIEVGNVRYHSSQPWPFPSSLMIGCIATATTREINIDEAEMHDVRWFERDEVVAVLDGEPRDFKLPGPIAIAHHLIRSWAVPRA